MIKSVINLEAQRAHVFEVLSDYAHYKDWLPGCEQSNVLSASGNSADTEITINSMKRMVIGLKFEAEPIQVLNFRLTKSKDLKGYSGSYRLMDAAQGEGTVVIAEMDIDAGAMVPRFMVDRMAKKSIDETGNALKAHLKKVPPKAEAAQPRPAAAAAAAPAVAKPRRAKRILRIVKTDEGYRVWIQGESYLLKQK